MIAKKVPKNVINGENTNSEHINKKVNKNGMAPLTAASTSLEDDLSISSFENSVVESDAVSTESAAVEGGFATGPASSPEAADSDNSRTRKRARLCTDKANRNSSSNDRNGME